MECILRGGPGRGKDYKVFLIESEAEVSNLPTSASARGVRATAGSKAFLQDMTKGYMLGADDEWREISLQLTAVAVLA